MITTIRSGTKRLIYRVAREIIRYVLDSLNIVGGDCLCEFYIDITLTESHTTRYLSVLSPSPNTSVVIFKWTY